MRPVRLLPVVFALAVGAAACGDDDGGGVDSAGPTTTTSAAATTTEPPGTSTTSTTSAPDPFARPDWLGTRELPVTPDGFGQVQPTPPELDPRRLATPEHLPPPADEGFHSSIEAVPDDVLDRSTWVPECPIGPDDLRYVQVSFWGFDGEHHTGELLVDGGVADDVVEVFGRLHDARFPIEEMRITAEAELDAPPTGDGNNTGAFVCRPVRGASSWSQHAYGRAIDLNPFHNPYVRGELVLPELASTYADRDRPRDGMLTEGGPAVEAFDAVGWEWGGRWSGLKDWMHFSSEGG